MLKNKNYKKVLIITLLVCLLIIPNQSIYARAGGGHSGGHGGGRSHGGSFSHSGKNNGSEISWTYTRKYALLFGLGSGSLILCVGCLGAASLSKHKKLVEKKSNKLKELGNNDPNWNIIYLKRMVEDMFYDIQYAWADDEYHKVQCLLSDRLYEKHIKTLDELKKSNKRNILKDIEFEGCRIVTLFEGNENKHGFIWVEVKFSMIDYIVDISKGNEVIEGNCEASKSDFEYWKFIYIDNMWFLSKILQKTETGHGLGRLYKEAEEANYYNKTIS